MTTWLPVTMSIDVFKIFWMTTRIQATKTEHGLSLSSSTDRRVNGEITLDYAAHDLVPDDNISVNQKAVREVSFQTLLNYMDGEIQCSGPKRKGLERLQGTDVATKFVRTTTLAASGLVLATVALYQVCVAENLC